MQRRSGFNIGSYLSVCILLAYLLDGRVAFSQTSERVRTDTAALLPQLFKNPPASAKPWVFWYWMQASVSRQGITADLEAMKQAGIAGAYLMPIKGPANPPYMDSVVVQLTPQWWEMVRHAAGEARRLGLKLGFHVSDGFALAGGPWITPELSMQKVVWTQTHVQGGKTFNEELRQPETLENYYRDIAVLAFPSLPDAGVSSNIVKPVITSSKPDTAAQLLSTPGNTRNFNCDDQCWVQYEFANPFTCNAIVIRSRNNYQSNRLIVQTSNDGINFTTLTRLDPPRHGWQDWDEDYTHAIPRTTSKYFRFVYDKTGSEPGAEDLDAAKWRPSLKVTGIELLAEPRIHQYEGKNGSVWRISKATTQEQVPDSVCVPLESIINISAKMDRRGRLTWDVPQGNWTILRMGHTSTGHKNETAGGGKGLECDKFNPDAVKLQFDNWFREIMRELGPGLAKEVIEYLHVDSWECGSQNWSAEFVNEFKKRSNVDLIRFLPAMAGVPVMATDSAEQALRDVRRTIAELINEKFYTTLRALAHANGVLLSAESVAPTMVSDGLLHYKTADIPMGEFWLRSPTHDKPNDMLDAISGAHIYGKRIIQAEGFTQLRMAWDEHPGILKSVGDRNFALGINRLFYHVFVHNPWMDRKPGMTLDAIGLYFQRDQTWWKQGRAWVEYVSRCQALLQAGEPVVDIAVFTGMDIPNRSILPDRLVPALPGIFGKDRVEAEKKRLANAGQPLRQLPAGVTHSANMADPENWVDPLRGYAYDSFNWDALQLAKLTKDKAVQFGSRNAYQLLIFPEMHLPGNKLRSIDSRPLLKFRDLAGSTAIVLPEGPYMDSSFASLGIPPDFIVHDENSVRQTNVAWTHRSGPDFDIYFVSNQADSARSLELSLRISGKIPEIWNPLTGSTMNARTWRIQNKRTILPVYLDANGSLFIIFRKETSKQSENAGDNWHTWKSVQTVASPWTVNFDPAYGGPAGAVVFNELTDWSKNSDTLIRYYSGTASYSNSFQWNSESKTAWLNVGTVANIAEVYVNGISCGIAWTAPYRVDISKALKRGTNTIRIEVSNTWANRMIGDRRLPENKRITNTIAPYRLEGKPLLPAGLLGPVTIESQN